jgi:NADPH2:quinone reductase
MRAWQVIEHGEPSEALKLVDIDEPSPGPGQLLMRTIATGVGLPDVFMCRGIYRLTPPRPFTPGQEAVGEVIANGEGTSTPVGTRLMGVTLFTDGHGGFAEQTLFAEANAFPVPEGLSDADAAGFWIPHLTAWIGLVERGRIEAGDWLVVLGAAGSSGTAAIQLGRALGARVVAVVGSDAKAELCRSLGAERIIQHSDGNLADAIREATDGHGADLVYDPVGGTAAETSIRAMARDGRLLAVGFASGTWPDIKVHNLVTANASVVGVFAGGYSRQRLDEMHRRMSELIASGELHSTVTHQASFEDVPHALERLASRDAVGKSVVLVAS